MYRRPAVISPKISVSNGASDVNMNLMTRLKTRFLLQLQSPNLEEVVNIGLLLAQLRLMNFASC